MISRRNAISLGASALVMPAMSRLSPAQTAAVQGWPTRNIKAVVPFAAGSTIDIVARIVLDPLATSLGQTIVVENRGGAGGTIGSNAVARSEADGYTLLVNASAHSAAPAAYPKIAYDPARDFSGVIPFGTVPNVMIIAPSKGIRTAQELAKAGAAGKLTYASAGVGSATHWAAERFRLSAGFTATHVPFRGGPDAITEVLTGRVDFACMGITSCLDFIQSGQLLGIAVSSTKRTPALPDVPTTIEAGFADSDYNYWMGILVPAKTPADIIERLRQETQKALASPNVMEKFAAQGIDPLALSPTEFDSLIRKEIASNIELAKAAGLKFN